MRLLIDSLIALMLVGILGVLLANHRQEREALEHHRQVHEALSVLYEQTLYHSVVDPEFGRNVRDPFGLENPLHRFPSVVDPRWFKGSEPRNTFAGARPWLDVAPPGDRNDHPPDPVLRRHDQAGFWYNPARGIFRARVPQQTTDAETLHLYNRLNNVALLRLAEEKDPSRAPSIPLEMQIATLRKGTVASAESGSTGGAAATVSGDAPSPTPAPTRRPALLRSAGVTDRQP